MKTNVSRSTPTSWRRPIALEECDPRRRLGGVGAVAAELSRLVGRPVGRVELTAARHLATSSMTCRALRRGPLSAGLVDQTRPAAGAFGPWSRGSANKALRSAARRAGRLPFAVYQIRHSFPAGLRRSGTDVADIQDLYGHTSPETTTIYAPIAPLELAKHRAPWNDCGKTMRADHPRRLVCGPSRMTHPRGSSPVAHFRNPAPAAGIGR